MGPGRFLLICVFLSLTMWLLFQIIFLLIIASIVHNNTLQNWDIGPILQNVFLVIMILGLYIIFIMTSKDKSLNDFEIYIKNILRKKKAGGALTDFEVILQALDNYKIDRIVQNEREFESIIFTYLKAKFPDFDIQFQYRISSGRSIDIVINDEIALELKIGENKGNLDDGFSKIAWYKEKGGFNQLAIVILDVGMINPRDLDEYEEMFSEKGAKVVFMKGDISRPR